MKLLRNENHFKQSPKDISSEKKEIQTFFIYFLNQIKIIIIIAL